MAEGSTKRTKRGRIVIGCSGWQYRWWKGNFYPEDLPSSKWLEFYTRHFQSVEINNTFYRLPAPAAFTTWRKRTPEGFVIAIKASRYLTHMKRLKDARPSLELLFARAAALESRLGPILFQLPPHLPHDPGRLREFLEELSAASPALQRPAGQRRFALEFRHPSWYVSDVFDLCKEAGIAICLHDMAGSELVEPATGPFVYVRFHGTSARYHGSYPPDRLREWARRIRSWSDESRDVYAYFNNDPGGAAVRDARALQVFTGRQVGAAA